MNVKEVKELNKKNGYSNLPNKPNYKKKYRSTKLVKCTVCGNDTYQTDCICVLCKNNITHMYKELIDLVMKSKRRVVYKRKRVLRTRRNQ
ncbi:MAG: hypothetical protein OEZ31_05555 [Nitrospirota bacterium]|nr:hypothetical protein [Nitrospirota bacterium]MDH5768407.1 hypothetical protein [Nitrospirota bacterium]